MRIPLPAFQRRLPVMVMRWSTALWICPPPKTVVQLLPIPTKTPGSCSEVTQHNKKADTTPVSIFVCIELSCIVLYSIYIELLCIVFYSIFVYIELSRPFFFQQLKVFLNFTCCHCFRTYPITSCFL